MWKFLTIRKIHLASHQDSLKAAILTRCCLYYILTMQLVWCCALTIWSFCNVINLQRDVDAFSRNYRTELERVSEIMDLSVLMDPHLYFKRHVESKVAKIYSMLTMWTREKGGLKICQKWGWDLWMVSSIESIRKKFIMFALRCSARRYTDVQLPPYDERRALIGPERLSNRRRLTLVFFLYAVLTGEV